MRRHLGLEETERYSLLLARQVWNAGFDPTHILTPVRGGPPIANYVHEFLRYKGLDPRYLVVNTEGYDDTVPKATTTVEGIGNLPQLTATDRVVIIDDIFDSGRSIDSIVNAMHARYLPDHPTIRIGTLFYKPAENKTSRSPDFYVEKTSDWIVFRHELMMAKGKPYPLEELQAEKGSGFAGMLD